MCQVCNSAFTGRQPAEETAKGSRRISLKNGEHLDPKLFEAFDVDNNGAEHSQSTALAFCGFFHSRFGVEVCLLALL